MALHGPDLPIRCKACNPPFSPSVTQRPRCTLPPHFFSLVATATATTTTGRPSLPRYSPGAQVFFGPFAVDEHHKVRLPLGLLFVLCKTEHPNPSLPFVFGSDLTTSVYACIMPTNFDCFAKIIGVQVYSHVLYWVRPSAPLFTPAY
jgi:hypothetical protein